MRIGLFNVDGKIPNPALMKWSAYHKRLGDDVEIYSPLFSSSYDKVYASKIFTYPHPNDMYLSPRMIIGGPGWNIKIKLPPEVDHVYPDYQIFNCKHAIGYIIKGCINECPFCIVSKMEGSIHKFAELEEFCRDQKKVMLLDNNILAYKDHLNELKKLIKTDKKFEFTQGFDIRLINEKNALLLRQLRRWKGYRIKFAFDHPELKSIIEKKLNILNKAALSYGILEFYVLIGFNTSHQENLMRINFLKEKGISAFVMPFNKMDPYQMSFARWVNRRLYKYQSFQEYLSTKTSSKREIVLEAMIMRDKHKEVRQN